MDASGRIDSEMKQAKKRINQLITKYKYNSDDYDAMGMIGESDAIAILEGATKVLRKALESIVKDYKIDKKQIGIISKHIDDIKTNLKKRSRRLIFCPKVAESIEIGTGLIVKEHTKMLFMNLNKKYPRR